MRQQQEDQLIGHLGPEAGWERMITEADGSLVPIVRNDVTEGAPSADRRKRKELIWREARLCLAHQPGQLTARYAATLGDVRHRSRRVAGAAVSAIRDDGALRERLTNAARQHVLARHGPEAILAAVRDSLSRLG